MQLTVLTYNTLWGGYDGREDRRARAQIELINEAHPDVFLMQEAKGFEANGAARLYELEYQLGMRGFLAPALHTGQHVAIFIRPPLRPIAFEADSVHFHHAVAMLSVALPGGHAPITFITAHLCPNGPDVRRREAAYLAVQAGSEKRTVLTGDFNSASPHDPEPEGLGELPPHHRTRYVGDDLRTADRSVLALLETAGWVDVGHRLDRATVPTVPTRGFQAAEFPAMRCDYVLVSAALAPAMRRYEVVHSLSTDIASDHYPVLVRFEVTP